MFIKDIARSCYKILPGSLQDRATREYIKHKKRKVDKLVSPTALIFFVTSRCNAKCAHCFYWDEINKKPDEMTLDEIGKIARSLRHPIYLSLTGGEPFLRQDITEICSIFQKENNCKNIGIASNGFLSDKIVGTCKKILDMVALDSLSVQISIDGLESTHNEIRGVKDGFQKAFQTVRMLSDLSKQAQNFSVAVSITIQQKNISEIIQVIEILSPLEIPVKFALVRGQDFGTYALPKDVSNDINPKEGENAPVLDIVSLEELFEKISEINSSPGYHFWSVRQQEKIRLSLKMMKEKVKQLPCYAAKIDGVLYANGDVALCELTKPIGNIKDFNYDFAEIWQSEEANRYRKKIRNCFCIHGCNMTTSIMFDPKMIDDMIKGK